MTAKALIISIDCLRADAVFPVTLSTGHHAGPPAWLSAPNLGALVQSGRSYHRAVTTSPYTTAAHASAFTGCHPIRHGVREYFRTPLSVPTIFEWASQAGIRTMFSTDYPLILGHHLGFTRGVDKYMVEDHESALDAFLATDGDALLFVHFADLHFPYGCHVIRNHREHLMDFLEAESARIGQALQPESWGGGIEAIRSPDELLIERRYRQLLKYLYAVGEYERLLSFYWGGLERFDQGRFARFAARLHESGHLESSTGLTILFGDHGEDWSPTTWAHFDSCDRSVLGVPIVVWADGGNASLPSEKLVSLIDVAPTIAGFFKLTAEESLEGRSLLRPASNQQRRLIAESWMCDSRAMTEMMNWVNTKGEIADAKALENWLAKDAIFGEAAWLQRFFDRDGAVIHRESDAYSGPNADSSIASRLEAELDRHYAMQAAPPGVPLDLWTAMTKQRYLRRG